MTEELRNAQAASRYQYQPNCQLIKLARHTENNHEERTYVTSISQPADQISRHEGTMNNVRDASETMNNVRDASQSPPSMRDTEEP